MTRMTVRTSTAPRLAEFLGLRRNVVLLLAAIILMGTGEETWVRFLPKYLETLGASVFVIGLFDGLRTLLGAVYAYPGGVLSDRLGYRRALLAFTAISIAGYTLVLLVTHWAAVLAGMFLFLAWTLLSFPATLSLVGDTLAPEKHTMGIGVQSLIRRGPIIVGPLLGGLLIDKLGIIGGVRAGLMISIVLAGIALAAQTGLRHESRAIAERPRNLLATLASFTPELRRLLFSDILIRFCERLPFAWVVIYAMNHLGATATQFGALVAIEMATAALCYVPTAHLADRYGKEPFIMATFVFFTLFPLAMLAAKSFPLLVVAFVVRGLKEFGEPARKALIVGHAPATARGQVIGAYYLVRDTVVAFGSFIGAALWTVGPRVNFVAAAALGAAGTILYAATLRRASARL